jgi:hypothetical protein
MNYNTTTPATLTFTQRRAQSKQNFKLKPIVLKAGAIWKKRVSTKNGFNEDNDMVLFKKRDYSRYSFEDEDTDDSESPCKAKRTYMRHLFKDYRVSQRKTDKILEDGAIQNEKIKLTIARAEATIAKAREGID